ncbi:MAG: succinyldiaminopimelate transaminase [Gammaproteobacteria bacterium]|nr:succinyldiaminopimelate transaminase [Gammaproteobacteria bacterium]
MNPDLKRLQSYPFEKLTALKQGIAPSSNKEHISLSIGEPKHSPPSFVTEEIITHLHGLSSYPLTKGMPALRKSIAEWCSSRFSLPENSLNPEENVLPVHGTREALFAFAQCVINRNEQPVLLIPNPFYQIYEGAALLAGAEPVFMNTTEENGFIPDFDSIPEDTWKKCQLIYLCSPGNPTGKVIDSKSMQKLIQLADQYDFIIASDECYSEIYQDENSPPPGLLQAAIEMGWKDYKRCIVFHSLSKRSNLPGLRSGFVAGDATIIKSFLLYRTYHGCAMPPFSQAVSILAWKDEQHVIQNRNLYREKFDAVLDILKPKLDVTRPDASFYLWPKTPTPDTEFARGLYEQQNVTVLPGTFLSRESNQINPGEHRIRMALVAPLDECIDAANRINSYISTL